MSLLLNILWIIFGGLWMAVGWLLAAVIMTVTIVGIPWARAVANIALYTLRPFGHTAVDKEEFAGRPTIGTGPLGVVGNVDLASVSGLVVGSRPSDHCVRTCDHHHWTAVCLGAFEAGWTCPLADRQRDRLDRRSREIPIASSCSAAPEGCTTRQLAASLCAWRFIPAASPLTRPSDLAALTVDRS